MELNKLNVTGWEKDGFNYDYVYEIILGIHQMCHVNPNEYQCFKEIYLDTKNTDNDYIMVKGHLIHVNNVWEKVEEIFDDHSELDITYCPETWKYGVVVWICSDCVKVDENGISTFITAKILKEVIKELEILINKYPKDLCIELFKKEKKRFTKTLKKLNGDFYDYY